MTGLTLRLPGSVAEIEGGPTGPKVGAFFDLDGTLIAGYSAAHLSRDRLRRREVSLGELAKTIGVAVGVGLGRASFDDLLAIGADAWRGRTEDDLQEMGERLFQQKMVDLIYPEIQQLVRAHIEQGHTVVMCTSATAYQAEPVARHLEIPTVLCNRFVVEDGVLTGEVEQPVIWGPTKSAAVQEHARELSVDLAQSYFYADGDEDAPLMYVVGNPRPTNPGKRLERIAKSRGWPVLRLSSPSSNGFGGKAKALASVAVLPAVGAAGVGVALVRRRRRDGVNTAISAWLSSVLAINGVKLNVIGRENLWVERPAVFIFNHRNNFDALMAARLVERDFTGVAKKELESNPVIGTFGKLAEVAFVDRSDSASAVESLKPIEELARKGLSIILAPEGTRYETSSVGPFKKGAFRMAMAAGIPIVPIVFRNADEVAGRDASSMVSGTVDVAILPPISVDTWDLQTLDDHIAGVREQFVRTLASWPEA